MNNFLKFIPNVAKTQKGQSLLKDLLTQNIKQVKLISNQTQLISSTISNYDTLDDTNRFKNTIILANTEKFDEPTISLMPYSDFSIKG